ncbi:MAG: dethiobiotin synthase [Oligosphaeraceae bacterium]
MGKVFFVSGIDTGVGKTIATGMMGRYLRQHGIGAITVKLVQTGCHGFSEDLELHRKLMGLSPLPEDQSGLTFPQTFDFPASPHLAAAREGRQVDCEAMAQAVKTVSRGYPVTLVEGAGGLAVPLTEDLLTVDFAAAQGWPVVLVCSGKLGSLNHALLSLEALRHRGMTLAGLVYNYCPEADPCIDQDTPRMLQKVLQREWHGAPLVRLGKVDPSAPEKTPMPDFRPLFSL